MLDRKRARDTNKQSILNDMFKMLDEILPDGDMGFEQSVVPETYLGAELGMNSIDVVKLIQAMQTKYNRTDLPFADLFMPEDRAVRDIRIIDLANFIYDHICD
jgi:hypothetical protein